MSSGFCRSGRAFESSHVPLFTPADRTMKASPRHLHPCFWTPLSAQPQSVEPAAIDVVAFPWALFFPPCSSWFIELYSFNPFPTTFACEALYIAGPFPTSLCAICFSDPPFPAPCSLFVPFCRKPVAKKDIVPGIFSASSLARLRAFP